MTSFGVVAVAGWLFVPNSAGLAINNGGTGGFITMTIVNFFGFLVVNLSLAEMASMESGFTLRT